MLRYSYGFEILQSFCVIAEPTEKIEAELTYGGGILESFIQLNLRVTTIKIYYIDS